MFSLTVETVCLLQNVEVLLRLEKGTLSLDESLRGGPCLVDAADDVHKVLRLLLSSFVGALGLR